MVQERSDSQIKNTGHMEYLIVVIKCLKWQKNVSNEINDDIYKVCFEIKNNYFDKKITEYYFTYTFR